MARFSSIFRLSNSQAELDFVDIDTAHDIPLYLDPYAIQIREDAWSWPAPFGVIHLESKIGH
jgi:hypothetical protein